jgi:hypothetical protein
MKNLNEKVSQIDSHINAAEYGKALSLVDEVLEWKPRSGKIYWRKLLAEQNCKNDIDLLRKGKVLHNNTAFANAMKYADDEERFVYALVEKTENLIVEHLKSALAEKELEDKRKTNAEKLLIEYREKFAAAEKIAQENISRLEAIEKSIYEQVIDCAAVANEYKYVLNDIHSATKTIGDTSKNEIFHEEKVVWESQLDMALAASKAEIEQLKHIESNHPVFLEYSSLVDKQKSIILEVNKNISEIQTNLRSQIQSLVSSIEKISNDYTDARIFINIGHYDRAIKLLSQEQFEEIVKQATSKAKGR